MSATPDPNIMTNDGMPYEWGLIPEPLLALLEPRDGVLTRKQRRYIDSIARGRWFLIRNPWREKCRSCKAKHTYLTLGCVERPFNGFEDLVQMFVTIEQRGYTTMAARERSIEPIEEWRAQDLLRKIADRNEPLYAPTLGGPRLVAPSAGGLVIPGLMRRPGG